MIAGVADGAETVRVVEERDLVPIELYGERRARQHLGAGTKPVPGSHVLPLKVFVGFPSSAEMA
jgi:hypothetical protein